MFIVGFAFIVSIIVAYTKILLHEVFNYVIDSGFKKKYILFYTIGYTIIIIVRIYYDSVPLFALAFLVVVIAEALVFYKRYYSLESIPSYVLFLLVSSIVSIMISMLAVMFYIPLVLGLGFLISL
jgi:hypothetical protein